MSMEFILLIVSACAFVLIILTVWTYCEKEAFRKSWKDKNI